LGDHQILSQEALEEAVMPAAQIVLLPVVEDLANMVWVVQEVGQHWADPEAEHVPEPFLRFKLKLHRVAQKRAEGTVGQRDPLGNARSFGHFYILHHSLNW